MREKIAKIIRTRTPIIIATLIASGGWRANASLISVVVMLVSNDGLADIVDVI